MGAVSDTRPKDLSGKRFGKLVVIKYLYSQEYGTQGKTVRMHLCQCDCGNTTIVSTGSLVSGNTRSCGCLIAAQVSSLAKNVLTTHGMSKTRLYDCYYHMKRRCSHDKNWVNKGIKVCDEWKYSFEAFRDWALSNGYSDNLTLDRIDPYGNYEPSNCRWATKKEQANNKTNNRYITIGNITHTLSEWSEISGVKAETIAKRIEAGYPEYALLTPTGSNYFTQYNDKTSYFHNVTICGETHTITEWGKISGIKPGTIASRIRHGWKEDDLLKPIGTIYHGSRKNNMRKFNGKSPNDQHSTKNIVLGFWNSGVNESEVDISRFKNAYSAQNAYGTMARSLGLPVGTHTRGGKVWLIRKGKNSEQVSVHNG